MIHVTSNFVGIWKWSCSCGGRWLIWSGRGCVENLRISAVGENIFLLIHTSGFLKLGDYKRWGNTNTSLVVSSSFYSRQILSEIYLSTKPASCFKDFLISNLVWQIYTGEDLSLGGQKVCPSQDLLVQHTKPNWTTPASSAWNGSK